MREVVQSPKISRSLLAATKIQPYLQRLWKITRDYHIKATDLKEYTRRIPPPQIINSIFFFIGESCFGACHLCMKIYSETDEA
jgi:FPC/CPF motif-containing protein YcgG